MKHFKLIFWPVMLVGMAFIMTYLLLVTMMLVLRLFV